MGATGAELPGLGNSIAFSFVSLGLVCLVAFVVLRWLGRRGIGRTDDSIRLVGRRVLEPRRVVYLIEVGERCFLVGVGDGPMTMLAEIERSAFPNTPLSRGFEKPSTTFGDVLAGVLGRRTR